MTKKSSVIPITIKRFFQEMPDSELETLGEQHERLLRAEHERLHKLITGAVWSLRPKPIHLMKDLVQAGWLVLLEKNMTGPEVPTALCYSTVSNTAVDAVSAWTEIPQRTYARFVLGRTLPKTAVRIQWRLGMLPLLPGTEETPERIRPVYPESTYPAFSATSRRIMSPQRAWEENEAYDSMCMLYRCDPGAEIRRRRKNRKDPYASLPFQKGNEHHTQQWKDAQSFAKRFPDMDDQYLPDGVDPLQRPSGTDIVPAEKTEQDLRRAEEYVNVPWVSPPVDQAPISAYVLKKLSRWGEEAAERNEEIRRAQWEAGDHSERNTNRGTPWWTFLKWES